MDMNSLKAEGARWLEIDRNQKTRREVEIALREENREALAGMFEKRLKFGTAGLRGKIKAGWGGMNDVTVIQTTQGLVRYVQEVVGRKNITMVVGYDARYNSEKWAKVVAAVTHLAGGSCYLYSTITPTPMVPYAVTSLTADVGVMVTASHNPKQDNGYKVYWSNGVQIIPPHDANIEASILNNLTPWPHVWDVRPPTIDPLTELQASYLAAIRPLCTNRIANATSPPLFAYTPVHGVGRDMVEKAFRMFGLPAPVVPPSQGTPDPAFPTAPFPNPEEPNVLDEVMKTAEQHNVPVVLANDPDADRLALAERREDGSWKVFNGNELGALIGAWCWQHRPAHVEPSKCLMIASRVSSRFLATMAEREGFRFEATLTGFKWIGNKAKELQEEGYTVLFGFEEAIGYMPGVTGVFDKDGVSTAALLGDMAVSVYGRGTTLEKCLNLLYELYGWHVTNNSYFLCYNPDTTHAIFKRLREYPDGPTFEKAGRRYPATLGPYEVQDVDDVDVGSSSYLITFFFKNSATVTIRTSGTEPKIKYYSELINTKTSKLETEEELSKMIRLMVAQWYQPEKNGLVAQAKM